MKKIIIIGLLLTMSIFVSACSNKYVCSNGQTVSDPSLCPTQNTNLGDIESQKEKQYQPFEISFDLGDGGTVGISEGYTPKNENSKTLTLTKDTTSNKNDWRILSVEDESKDSYSYQWGVSLIVFTKKSDEPVSCNLKEYYGNTLNGEKSYIMEKLPDSSYFIQHFSYSLEESPANSKIVVECSGTNSGLKATNTFYTNFDYQ